MHADRKRLKLLKAAKLERKEALDAGDAAAAAAIAEELIRPLQRELAGAALAGLQNEAQALNALSDILETALARLQGRIDRMFIDDIVDAAREVAILADERTDVDRFGAADDTASVPPRPEPDAAPAPAARPAAPSPAPAPAPAPERPPPETPAAYADAYAAMELRSEWDDRIANEAALFLRNDAEQRYRAVSTRTGVPWWVIGVLHKMEASQNFRKHLHNGDPLDEKTVNKPAGRPPGWRAGMAWEDSAVDALAFDDLTQVQDWSLGAFLERAERWNGLGYRSRGLWSPFLWAGSRYYDKGKFVSDGVFDPGFESRQVGIAPLMQRLFELGVLEHADGQSISVSSRSALASPRVDVVDTTPFPHAADELDFPMAANQTIEAGMGTGRRDTAKNRFAVRRVQEWLTLQDFVTSIDGEYGDATVRCVQRYQRAHSLPDSGSVDQECWMRLTRPMRNALTSIRDPRAMVAPGLAETVIAVGSAHLAAKAGEVGGNNAGPWVRLYMQGTDAGIGGGDSHLWCAGFVCFLIAQACRDLGAEPPFAAQALVANLVADAKADGRFIDGDSLGDGATRASRVPIGGVFVRRGGPNGWDHAGIVEMAEAGTFSTIEGNTTGGAVEGGRDGGITKRATRSYGRYDFIRLA